jgi:hypothetical protein
MVNGYRGGRAFVIAGLLVGSLVASTSARAEELSERAVQQLRAILAEKASRTPAQRKLATPLLYASRASRGLAMVQGLPPQQRVVSRAGVAPDGTVVVDIRGEVTDALLQAIAGMGGHVVVALPSYGSVRARVPVRRLEALAELPEVRHVAPKQRYLINAVTTQGDVAHAAASVRSAHGVDGTGVKVGVLSDGVNSLAARQTAGELPVTCAPSPGPGACVTVVPGQAGSGDEGTAIMEVVHDIAPGAKLYFATGADPTTLDAGFAQNILTLKNNYGCDIILDDVTYLNEGAFQDGVIAQAVNSVKAAGALYFSSAGNSGRKDASASGTWEGDYLNSGRSIAFFTGTEWQGKEIHSWNLTTGAGALISDALTADAPYAISLKWSDPLGAAVTDYDLFLFTSDLTSDCGVGAGPVCDYSTEAQDCPPGTDPSLCSTEPYEEMGLGYAGERIVVVRWSGPAKALRLDTYRGRLAFGTARSTFGHNAAESAVTVAATDVASASGGAFTGGTTNPVESYSSDGPRRIFYNPTGVAITPGNVLFATGGGRDVKKPDLTAADCVVTASPATTPPAPPNPFNPFCGTSAAAPHAAGIAALLESLPNNLSGGQVFTAMYTTALPVTPDTNHRNAGAGIVMANRAAAALTTIPTTAFYALNPCRALDTRTTGGAISCGTERDVTMAGVCGVPSGAKSVSLNVTVTQPTAAGNVRVYAAGAPTPTVSSLNYSAGQTRGNNAVAPLSTGGHMNVFCSPSGTTHVVVDVNGYFK